MIKQEVPVVNMIQIDYLISRAVDTSNMDYYLESSTIPTFYQNAVKTGIPYNNSDAFNNIPHMDVRSITIIKNQLHKMIGELK